MNEEIMQGEEEMDLMAEESPEMEGMVEEETTPDQAAGTLAFFTNLSEQINGGKVGEEAATEEIAMDETMEEPVEAEEETEDMGVKMEEMINEKVKAVLKEEMAGLKKELKAMLDE